MSRSKPRTIIVIAFVLRMAVVLAGHTYRINPRNDFQNFGFEMGRVARSVATGQGFSSPFDLPTGATAIVPPLFPYLLAGIFKIFGVYTRAAAIAIMALDSLFSSLVCGAIYAICVRIFGRSGGGALAASLPADAHDRPGEGAGAYPIEADGSLREDAGAYQQLNAAPQQLVTSDQQPATSDLRMAAWCAWTWALFPYAVYWPARMIWETSLSALLMSLAVLQTLRIDQEWGRIDDAPSRELREWLIMGAIWGAMALTNPALLAVAPVSVLWLAAHGGFRFSRTAAAVALALVIVFPWVIRNYRVFHRVMLRDNFWMEVWISNNPQANALWTRSEHPGNDPGAMLTFQRLGETSFMDAEHARAYFFIRQHPAIFIAWCFQRVFYFWAGEPKDEVVGGVNWDIPKHIGFGLWSVVALLGLWLMEKREVYASGLFAGLLILYPIAYYITRASPRYRHPIEPVLVILTVYALVVLSRPQAQPLRSQAA